VPTYIYALHCPIAKTVRYIGKSVDPTERFEQHLYFAKTRRANHHTARWIRKVLSAGLTPTLEVFYEVREDEDWREAERFWIAEAESFGWRLTNTTAGGDGVEMTCPIAIASWKKAVKARWQDPVLRKRNSEKLAAYYATPEGKANKIRTSSRPEKLEASRQSQIALWKTREYREKQMALIASPKLVEKASELSRRLWAEPDFRAKQEAAQAKRKAARLPKTPEQIAESFAKRKASLERGHAKRREIAQAFAASPEGIARAEANREAQRAMFAAMSAASAAKKEQARLDRIEAKNSPEAIAAREAKKAETKRLKNERRASADRAKKESIGVKVRRAPYPPEQREEMNKARKKAQRTAKLAAERAILAATTATPYTESS
jgi:hypothetical protein